MLADPVRFGRFEIQPRERRLLVDGQPAALGARAFDLLLVLAARPDELVTKNELLEAVWGRLVVEESNLAVQVSALRKLLGGEVIATIPGRGYRFVAPLGQAPTPTPTPARAPAPAPAHPTAAAPHAPALPALIGRDDDLARLEHLLQAGGCITLTGPAGVGKTSLARAVGGRWPAGSVWLDLAALSEAAQLSTALARALALALPTTAAAMAQAIGARLLLVDNAEHLVDATAALLAALLDHAREYTPALRVLVTSQLPLGLAMERVQRLEPLALPLDSDALDPHHGAVALLCERVQAADSRLRPGPQALPLLREICRRLDGLPLALEMAAARVPALGLAGVRDALDRRFALLTTGHRHAPGRHRTLHAALDWSHALLGAAEQRLFRHLGVFTGGFTLDLAVALQAAAPGGPGGGDHDRWAVIDTLSALVDRSLVAVDARDPPRYRLLETMRSYALEQLAAAGEEAALRAAHAAVLNELFQRGMDNDSTPAERALPLNEHDNVREAIAWARGHDANMAAQLAHAAGRLATFTTWRLETIRWLDDVASIVDDPRVTPLARADYWHEVARQKVMSRDAGAEAAARHARALYLALGHDRGVFGADNAVVRGGSKPPPDLPALLDEMEQLLRRHPEWPPLLSLTHAGSQGWAQTQLGDHEGALASRRREALLARKLQRPDSVDAAETNIAQSLMRLGRPEEALEVCNGLLARLGERDSFNAAYAWRSRLRALLELGRLAEARAGVPRTLEVNRRCDMGYVSFEVAHLLAHAGHLAAAVRVAGHALRRLDERGAECESDVAAALLYALAAADAALPAAQVAALLEEGRLLDDAELDALIADPVDPSGPART